MKTAKTVLILTMEETEGNKVNFDWEFKEGESETLNAFAKYVKGHVDQALDFAEKQIEHKGNQNAIH